MSKKTWYIIRVSTIVLALVAEFVNIYFMGYNKGRREIMDEWSKFMDQEKKQQEEMAKGLDELEKNLDSIGVKNHVR